jgi:PAS domain S-box-containing protein
MWEEAGAVLPAGSWKRAFSPIGRRTPYDQKVGEQEERVGVDELFDTGFDRPPGAKRRDPADQLRRREHQQALVAELGRSALTGTPLDRLAEEAVAAAAAGLGADRVGLLEPAGDGTLVCRSAHGWPEDELRPVAIDADSQVAETFRRRDPIVVDDFGSEKRYAASRHLVELGLASGAAAPVRGEGEPVGVLVAHSREPRAFGMDDVVFLRAVANVIAVVTARELAEERRRRSEEGLTFLAEAGHILAATLDYDTTLSTLASLVVPRLADWFIVDLAEEDGTMRRVAVAAAQPEKRVLLEELSRSYPPSAGSPQPAARALERGGTVHFPDFTPESLQATTRDERHFELMTKLDPRSAIAVPLMARGRTLGALTFAWSESGRRYEATDLALAEEVARRAAVAIDNARLYRSEQATRTAAEEAQRRMTFVAEASATLSSSLDYGETLGSLARLAVPRLADWCLVYGVRSDGSIERLAVEHGGGRQDVVRTILDRHELDPQAPVGVPRVIRTGRSELLAETTPTELAEDVQQPGELVAALADIDVRSTMCVPLVARARTVGAILFIAAESGRRYTEDDLELAEEIAARAALALDNSRLYREAEERGEAARALATIADGVFLVDEDGVIRIWNAAAAAITGLAAADVRGRPAREVLPDWERIASVVPVGPPRQRPAPPKTVPLVVSGRELWLSISGVGSSEGAVYAFRDVTEERRLEQLKSDFVATVSHELRTPLAAVYGSALTLAGRDLAGRDEIQRALVGHIAEQSARLAAIVEDILLTGELDAGGLRVERAEVDPLELARSAVEAARARAGKAATIELVAPERVGSIDADAGRLRQVLDNLIENAIKYSPDGSRTEVRIEENERTVCFSVVDEGIGIPLEEHERIFEKFYRLDPEQAHGVGGSGLGLYVCRELVERMDGRISVDSAPGRGSVFRIELPRRSHGA